MCLVRSDIIIILTIRRSAKYDLSQAVIAQLQRNHTIRVTLDGLYGQELSIGDYELAILVADGKGISGVLPFVLSALSRRKYDKLDKAHGLKSPLYKDKTRKVDLIWRLDHKSQVEWASSYFQTLADLESSNMDQDNHIKPSKVSIPNIYQQDFYLSTNIALVSLNGVDHLPELLPAGNICSKKARMD